MQVNANVDDILAAAKQLSPADQAHLLASLATLVSQQLPTTAPQQPDQASAPQPRETFYGMWAKFGPAPSEEEIEEVRKEMWGEMYD